MVRKDVVALLKAVEKALEPAGDLFQARQPLTLDSKDSAVMAKARQAVAQKTDLDYRTGTELLGIYKRAYQAT